MAIVGVCHILLMQNQQFPFSSPRWGGNLALRCDKYEEHWPTTMSVTWTLTQAELPQQSESLRHWNISEPFWRFGMSTRCWKYILITIWCVNSRNEVRRGQKPSFPFQNGVKVLGLNRLGSISEVLRGPNKIITPPNASSGKPFVCILVIVQPYFSYNKM